MSWKRISYNKPVTVSCYGPGSASLHEPDNGFWATKTWQPITCRRALCLSSKSVKYVPRDSMYPEFNKGPALP